VLFVGGAPAAQLMLAIGEAGASPSFYGISVVDGDQVAKAMGAKLRGLATSQVVFITASAGILQPPATRTWIQPDNTSPSIKSAPKTLGVLFQSIRNSAW